MSKHEDWSAITVPKCPDGTVLTICKANSTFMEFAGGKRNRKDHTPQETAARELYEEVGIRVQKHRFKLAGEWVQYNTGTHQPYKMYLFVVELTEAEAASHFQVSKERELVGRFSWPQLDVFHRTGHFSRYHYDKLVEHGVWHKK